MRHTTVGLLEFSPERSFKGITIVTPLHGKTTYLIGMLGEVLHQWDHPAKPGNYAYLLPGGNLLWAGETEKGPKPGGGKGGLLREYDWEGNVLWEYRDDHQHHDFRRLQNGNTIYIGWEKMPKELQSRMIGAEAGSEDKGGVTWSDYVKEIDPKGKTVWEWHAHTDLEIEDYPLHIMSTRKEFLHCNTCAELPDGNIMLSFRKNSMVVVIDKVTKKVIKKWQNDSWGQQHDSQLLENGNVLIFANGIHVAGPGVFGSKVIEFDCERPLDGIWSLGLRSWTLLLRQPVRKIGIHGRFELGLRTFASGSVHSSAFDYHLLR